MRLASVVQHSVKAPPLKHDVASLRVSTISALKRTGVPFPHSHFSSSFAVARGRRGQFYPVASARGAEQEDDLSTSGTEGPTSWAYDDLDKVNSSSRAFPSVDKQEQSSQGRETYRPSVQTVVLCVLAAVAFGVGIGLKDGVGKATEFFTGYILEQSLSVDNLFVFVLIFKYFKVPFACQVLYKPTICLKKIRLHRRYVVSDCSLDNIELLHVYHFNGISDMFRIESGAFVWNCWCSCFPFVIDITWNSYSPEVRGGQPSFGCYTPVLIFQGDTFFGRTLLLLLNYL
uniref:Uncharacterized protein LOC103419316 isoform X4 n=1 Tax=Rhizophora mucronata TaxID=61149 RepID=A0A2P2L5H6_RHIMU